MTNVWRSRDTSGCDTRLTPGAQTILNWLRAREFLQLRFLTNNSTVMGAQIAHRLAGMGLEVESQHILTATELVGHYLLGLE
ncbi:hypothetical protein [Paenibacillus koleovorans]|uniref:hypothetical protein n=1 Tax=Paenibacillus koleovorans TaxID=121608 RepID=UPI000FD7C041